MENGEDQKRKDSNPKEWISDQGVFAVAVTALTIIIGIILAEVQPKFGWLPLLLGLLVVTAIDVTLIIFLQKPLTREVRAALMTISRRLDTNSITWLLDTEALAEFETKVGAQEIWLLTCDLLDDVGGGPFQSIVADKICQGTKYTFFVPDILEIKTRVHMLQSMHKRGLRVIYLPESFFFLTPRLDIVVYDPLSSESEARTAYMGIPARGETGHYHARLSAEFVDKLVGKLLEHIENTSSQRQLGA